MTFNAFRTPDLPLKKGSFLKKLPDRMEKMTAAGGVVRGIVSSAIVRALFFGESTVLRCAKQFSLRRKAPGVRRAGNSVHPMCRDPAGSVPAFLPVRSGSILFSAGQPDTWSG